MASELKVDTISEKTSGGGVTIDGVLLKDGGITGDIQLSGTTPSLTIGDAGAEDAKLVFDGNAQDFYIALDDSADDLIIGLGSAVGTTPMLSFTEAKAAAFTGAVTMASTLGVTGVVTGAGFTAGSAVLAEAELELLDGLTAGTAIASKVVTTDGSIDTSGQRNLTISGELDAATLDISGAIDIAGNSQFSGTVTVGVDDTGKDVKLFGATASSHLLWDESADTLNLVASTLGVGAVGTKDLGAGIHIKTSDSSATANAAADELVIEANANSGISILSSTSTAGRIYFGDSGDDDIGQIRYNHDDNSMNFKVNALADSLVIHSNGMITKPLQPLFKVQQTGALSVADGHNLFSTNLTEAYDVNADVAANGQFTAPVDGYYQFSFTVLYKDMGTGGADDAVEDQFISSNLTETGARYGKLDDAILVDAFAQSHATTILFMDASDTCKIVHADGGTMAVETTALASHFEGHLLQ